MDTFQDVFRRLRRKGRADDDDRDVSDSILKAMEYARRRKSREGAGSESGGSGG